MNSRSRVLSVLQAPTLDVSVTGLPSFHLSELELSQETQLLLPDNLRLGHLVERIVSSLIRVSKNYRVLHQGVQLIDNNKTVGEIDLIIQNAKTAEVSHIELAYKFYLYDPGISNVELSNWIGPNRNDSLEQKLFKTKTKQFPLLYHDLSKSLLGELKAEDISQRLCLMASLFLPLEFRGKISEGYERAVRGFYLSLESLLLWDHSERTYYLPEKKEWGVNPSDQQDWQSFDQVHDRIQKSIDDKRSLLCWEKHNGAFSSFFIVWW